MKKEEIYLSLNCKCSNDNSISLIESLSSDILFAGLKARKSSLNEALASISAGLLETASHNLDRRP